MVTDTYPLQGLVGFRGMKFDITHEYIALRPVKRGAD